jgi:hypothetical protein
VRNHAQHIGDTDSTKIERRFTFGDAVGDGIGHVDDVRTMTLSSNTVRRKDNHYETEETEAR